jgi:hypothetical protein
MRLLTHNDNGKLVLRAFDSDPFPPYAILSHTWHTDSSQEVSFQDLEAGRAESKAGYGKIQFCAQQATRHGLQYFWVDTCCIDKSSSAELTEAINSMFRWYRKSIKCYVYLSDVSCRTHNDNGKRMRLAVEEKFEKSRWFKRGWTLQELLAPSSVDFFSQEGDWIGSKGTLESLLSNITGIDIGALRGVPLSDFRIDERFSWAVHRETKRSEDKAYSLLGIFDVSMPSIYGEGEEKALVRLRELITRPKE